MATQKVMHCVNIITSSCC